MGKTRGEAHGKKDKWNEKRGMVNLLKDDGAKE